MPAYSGFGDQQRLEKRQRVQPINAVKPQRTIARRELQTTRRSGKVDVPGQLDLIDWLAGQTAEAVG